jgi:hypothetical protein
MLFDPLFICSSLKRVVPTWHHFLHRYNILGFMLKVSMCNLHALALVKVVVY